ncbi:MAG: hybrid sensor histidine kinase/response regulator [Sulfuricurvum sp.]|nr:hybrid sensor histidine kinase/response regulator [Sulfuricurvum sp.]
MKSSILELKQLAADRTILIVEDDEEVLESLTRLLSHFFTTIHTASNVLSALDNYHKLYSKKNPIVVITDINLGIMTGIDLTIALKEIDPTQKIIAISGTEDRDIFIESIRCGVDSFVIKPINQYELFHALITILKKIDYDQELKTNQALLEDTKEYALRLLEEQDQFLKNAVHEIYTPLAVIITNIDLLRMDGINNESLSAIEAGARIIQNSYEDMTYLMKHDRLPEQISLINLVDFITKRIQYFTCIAEVNELSISMRVGQSNIPNIEFSELKLSRLIDNNLSNAIKYSHRPSEINITIGIYEKNIFFEVRNHGPIIIDKKKIFERYHRESEYKGGYGIGLSIVAQICDEENIDIKISSTPKRGTSFRYIFKNATRLQHNLSTIPYTNMAGEKV